MWPFSRRRPEPVPVNTDARDQLLAHFLARDEKNRTAFSDLEQKRLEYELRKMEIEMENLGAVREQNRLDSKAREELREQRRAHAANMRAARDKKRAAGPEGGPQNCRVCRNQSDPSLSANEIYTHYSSGHSGPPVDMRWPTQ